MGIDSGAEAEGHEQGFLYKSGRRYQTALSFWMLLRMAPDGYYFPLINLLDSNEAVRQEVFP